LTNEIQDVLGNEQLDPILTTIDGACKVISLEYPKIQCKHIDLPRNQHFQDIPTFVSKSLIPELQHTDSDVSVAFRGTHRWIPSHERVQVELPAQDQIPLKQKGIYLITGGFGGMGRTIAKALAHDYQAKLILTGRVELPPRDKWEHWLLNNNKEDVVSQRLQQILDLEKAGAEVLPYQVDIADFSSMEIMLQSSTRIFGKINGVFHCAGLADYAGIIQLRSRADTEDVLAPKIKGTLNLYELLENSSPDFMVLASTIGSVLYHSKFGQVGYCAANNFLDAFAIYQNKKGGIRTQVINWNDWADVGMTMKAVQKWTERSANQADWESASVFDDFLSPKEGVDVLFRAMASQHPRLMVCTRDLNWALAQDKTNKASVFLSQSEPAEQTHRRPELSSNYVVPESGTEKKLTAIWKNFLGMEGIGREDDFFELGGHSLIGIQILAEIQETFGIEMQINELFAKPTVFALAAHIDEALGQHNHTVETETMVSFEEEGEL